MSKDYSHIKRGMCVPLRGMDAETYLKLVEVFREAGYAIYYGAGDWHLVDEEKYYGIDTDGEVMMYRCAESFTDNCGENIVTADFILNGPKTSSEALQDTLEEKVTEVLTKEENGLESNTGASVNISVLVSVQGNNYQLTRDQAYKLWEDLTEIFEEKIV